MFNFTNKNLMVMLILILFLICFFPHFVLAANHPLQDAFYLTGAKLQEVNVDGWSRLNTDYLGEAELRLVLERVKANIPLKLKKTQANYNSGNWFQMVIFSGEIEKCGRIFISIQSINHKLNGKKRDETYLAVSLNYSGNGFSLRDTEALVKEILKKSGTNGQIASCLTGRINGKLGKESKNKIIKKIITQLSLDIIQQDIDSETMSLLGYSPLLGNNICLKGHIINVNLISRYDELKMQTEILLGSPLISVDL